jgi:3-mercaptopyruvate sulfurtransferase SseA/sterol desaturase/sphingolipid hydroxylase (fatty acid hydroxylase superfamily)
MWTYPFWLAVFSVLVAALERIAPWRREQRQLRSALWSDALHLVFNGHFLGLVLFGVAANYVIPYLDSALASAGLRDVAYLGAAASWPVWLQAVVALVVVDFLQWSVHNALHRIPLLWETHKVHHSVVDGEMDWIVSFRFQWTEVVVYRSVLYLPLAFFGFAPEAVMFHAVFGTLIGHFNHANLDISWGPLRYVLNSPRMHIWHHDYDGDAKTTVNFGIILSVWDWVFGTAKMPDEPPKKLGFAGVEDFPTDFFGQMAWPLWSDAARLGGARKLVSASLGAGVLAFGWWAHLPASASLPSTPMFGEVAASSQPAARTGFAYATDDAQREDALAAFGRQAKADGYAHPEDMVSAGELARALGHDRLVLLDVRPAERFETGHIPTAQQITRGDYSVKTPIPGLSRDQRSLEAALAARGVDEESVVVLYGDGGPEPYRLWWTLKVVCGYRARVLDGGLSAWKREGHGIAEGAGLEPPPGRVAMAAHDKPAQVWDEVSAFTEAAVILDTRSEAEFLGREKHKKAARAGRMPGAKHLDWVRVLRGPDDSRLKPPAQLRTLFDEMELGEGRVVTMCQSGTRSSAVLFALHQVGLEEDRLLNYDGSWAEYSRLSALPIETGAPAQAKTTRGG